MTSVLQNLITRATFCSDIRYGRTRFFLGNKFGKFLLLQSMFFVLILFCPLHSLADENAHGEIGVGGGLGGVFDAQKRLFILAEYRFKYNYLGISPWITLHTSGKETYVTSGLFKDLDLSKHWCITPGFSLGLYGERDGMNLGSPLEFKSSLEISYKTSSQRRIGLRISHISNGGLDEHNPGAEMLSLFFTFPVRD